MPIDDSRPTRRVRAAPAPPVKDTCPSAAALEPRELAELRQQIKDIDEGREESGMPWEAARLLIFAPPIPEESAAIDENRVRRARR